MNTEQTVLILLSLLVSALSYWAVRLDSRVNDQEKRLASFKERAAGAFVHKEDCRQTHLDMKKHLARIENKLDRLIEKGLR